MPPSTRGRLLAVCCLAIGLTLLLAGAAGLAASAVDAPSVTDRSAPAAAPPQPVEGLDLPERMDLSGSITDGTTAVGIDAGAAVQHGSTGIDATYDGYLLEERLDRADGDAEREALLSDAIDRANASVLALRERERTAREEFTGGDIDEREFVTRLRAIHERAGSLESFRSTIDARAEDVDEQLSSDATMLQSSLIARQGDVRATFSRAAAGDLPVRQIYVAASADGVVLAEVSDGTFLRETNRDDLFTDPRSVGIGWDAMDERYATELYPGFLSDNSWANLGSEAGAVIYGASGNHEHGRLEAYLDGHSEDVFLEHHQLNLDDDTPTLAPTNTSSGSLELQVFRTYQSGPARVAVIDDGQRVVGAPITVGDTQVGRTGEDGTAWVVLPYGDTAVETSVADTTLTAAITWGNDGRAESTSG